MGAFSRPFRTRGLRASDPGVETALNRWLPRTYAGRRDSVVFSYPTSLARRQRCAWLSSRRICGDMLCELCHKLDATVHLVKKAPGKEPTKRHLCEVCFPADSMSDSEQAQKLLELFGDKPPDGMDSPSTP